ncbi:MarR family winged helix-turn-helix transcriptional regulator [Nonomuraea soli]|uniref:DNA-binding MarR family transcriptional regulator n=1 Tax=Nonomuraea soli TaxID=1032476 RepID=A0A7W0HUC6_9ACTN|nr:MarR family transcriptional regulator [Nonomuraea soli]MBA2895822.1 DNA-binding MarR family transcriptional regulator [Nonomuraea soli]
MRPTSEELAVWRLLHRAQVQIAGRLEDDLMKAHDLPLASYEVLLRLSEAPGLRLRMNDLAHRVLLSRSGLTRLVDRLQREGLVSREACESDARGLYAVLTAQGKARVEEATPVYLRGIRRHFLDLLDPDDVGRCREMLAKLGVV